MTMPDADYLARRIVLSIDREPRPDTATPIEPLRAEQIDDLADGLVHRDGANLADLAARHLSNPRRLHSGTSEALIEWRAGCPYEYQRLVILIDEARGEAPENIQSWLASASAKCGLTGH